MIKEMLVSFADNIKTKTSNPFFGTLILVWATKNWNLIYSLFNFDSATTLAQKKEFITNYFLTLPFVETLLWSILETFIIIILSYFLINLSRLIINMYEKRLTPLIYKWTDEQSIVLKSVYVISENERKRLERRLDEEREAKLRLQEDYDKLEKRIADLINEKDENLKNKETEKSTNSPKQKDAKSIDIDKLFLITNKLEKEDKVIDFEQIASDILNGEYIRKSHKNIAEYTTLGLVAPGSLIRNPDYYSYSLTELGKRLHEEILLRSLK